MLKTIILLILITSFIFCKSQTNGYKVCFDYENKIAKKVEYTVIPSIFNLKRKGSFRKSKGSLSPSDYKGSGYDKGHLFPEPL